MDQFVSACGEPGSALLIDCRAKTFQPCSLPNGVAIVVANSNVKHELTGSEYPDRVRQCREAVQAIRSSTKSEGMTHLRDSTLDDLELSRQGLPDVTYRRAHHVISENR